MWIAVHSQPLVPWLCAHRKSDVKQSIQRMPKVCHGGLELFLVPFAVTRLQVVFEDFWYSWREVTYPNMLGPEGIRITEMFG